MPSLIIPPIKCQGIKTKIVPAIKEIAQFSSSTDGTWIEPFCGSCVVALNIQPQRAVLADTNQHLINLYRAMQSGAIDANIARHFLEREGERLLQDGARYYYEVRDRFNRLGAPLDFLFLNRSCFNGVIRFNKNGKFNVPFGHKPERFRPAYVTKIVNQIKAFCTIVKDRQWRFEVASFVETIRQAGSADFIYADPPYYGRHVDYFNTWGEGDEIKLIEMLKRVPCRFLLSTWHSNQYRQNLAIDTHWSPDLRYVIKTINHFYHVGAAEHLRSKVTEALISNYRNV